MSTSGTLWGAAQLAGASPNPVQQTVPASEQTRAVEIVNTSGFGFKILRQGQPVNSVGPLENLTFPYTGGSALTVEYDSSVTQVTISDPTASANAAVKFVTYDVALPFQRTSLQATAYIQNAGIGLSNTVYFGTAKVTVSNLAPNASVSVQIPGIVSAAPLTWADGVVLLTVGQTSSYDVYAQNGGFRVIPGPNIPAGIDNYSSTQSDQFIGSIDQPSTILSYSSGTIEPANAFEFKFTNLTGYTIVSDSFTVSAFFLKRDVTIAPAIQTVAFPTTMSGGQTGGSSPNATWYKVILSIRNTSTTAALTATDTLSLSDTTSGTLYGTWPIVAPNGSALPASSYTKPIVLNFSAAGLYQTTGLQLAFNGPSTDSIEVYSSFFYRP